MGKVNLAPYGICIFSCYLHCYQKKFQKFPHKTCNIWPKVAALNPPPPYLARVWPLECAVFRPSSSTYQKRLKLSQCLEIEKRRSLSKFGDITWLNSHFRVEVVKASLNLPGKYHDEINWKIIKIAKYWAFSKVGV